MKTFALFILVLLGTHAPAQTDSLNLDKKKAGAKNVGLCASGNYGLLRMKSDAFFTNDGSVGKVKAHNASGLSGGIFFLIPSVPLRVALEGTFLNTQLTYDITGVYKPKANIYNLNVDIPVSYLHYFGDPIKMRRHYLAIGPRFSFPISGFYSDLPKQRTVMVNGELSFGMQRPTAKTTMNVEFFYSLGLLNIISGSADDYRQSSIQSLHRDVIGLRFLFN